LESPLSLDVYYTVEGDFLVTSTPGFDPDNPDPEEVDLWVRFICTR